ncbi:MAG: hypothetical protein HZA54_03235 [Planctomycetes bacterium]|nr:hypothetical protein [Planctomycetota bacterium]
MTVATTAAPSATAPARSPSPAATAAAPALGAECAERRLALAFRPPAGWIVAPPTPAPAARQVLMRFTDPRNPPCELVLRGTPEPFPTRLAAWHAAARSALEAAGGAIAEEVETEIDGRRAIRFCGRAGTGDAARVHLGAGLELAERLHPAFALNGPVADEPRLRQLFDAVLASVRTHVHAYSSEEAIALEHLQRAVAARGPRHSPLGDFYSGIFRDGRRVGARRLTITPGRLAGAEAWSISGEYRMQTGAGEVASTFRVLLATDLSAQEFDQSVRRSSARWTGEFRVSGTIRNGRIERRLHAGGATFEGALPAPPLALYDCLEEFMLRLLGSEWEGTPALPLLSESGRETLLVLRRSTPAADGTRIVLVEGADSPPHEFHFGPDGALFRERWRAGADEPWTECRPEPAPAEDRPASGR